MEVFVLAHDFQIMLFQPLWPLFYEVHHNISAKIFGN